MKLSFSFRCALVSAAIFIAIKLAAFFTHTQFSGIGAYSGLIALGLTGIPLYSGIKYKRDQELGGYITVRQVWMAGIKISIMASILIALYTFIHYSFIETNVMDHWTPEIKRLGTLDHKTDTEIQEKIKDLTEFYSPFKQATAALQGILGTGAVLSFIFSTILVKKPGESES